MERVLQHRRAETFKKNVTLIYSTYSVMKASIVERFNRWRMICGSSSRSTAVTNSSTCYRVSCWITMLESIERSACNPLT